MSAHYIVCLIGLIALNCLAQESSFEDLFREAFECSYCPDSVQLALYTKVIDRGVDRPADASNIQNAFANRARLYDKTGEYQKAIDDFETALAIGPEDYFLRRELGTAYLQAQKYRDALRELDLYISRAEKEMQEALEAFAVDTSAAHSTETLSDLADSRRRIKSRFLSELAIAYNNRGIAKGNLRKHEAACADFRKAYEAGMRELKYFIESECGDDE